MEFISFLKVLWRQKFILIAIPLITVAITFFLVRNLANTYSSRSRVATGIIDRPDAILNKNTSESKINQDFNSIIERLLQKRTLKQVSYLLLLHDLKNNPPYRIKSKQVNALSSAEREVAIQTLETKYKNWLELNLLNSYERKVQDLLESMRYDELSIRKNLIAYRVNNSDYIDMQFESESPQMSAFVLYNLCKEFIEDYTSTLNENKNKTIAYLNSLMQQKQDSLHKKMMALQNYKVRNGVLDVDNQASTLIGQIAQFEAQRQEAQKNINAYQGALKNIDARFDPNDRRYVESSLTELNQDILLTRNRLSAMNDDYIKSNFDSRMKARMDSVQSSLAEKINQTNDKLAYSPVASRNGLVQEKMNMEISLELAKNSVSSLSGELSRLNGKLYTLVPNQAAIKTLQDDINIYSKEYNDLSSQYNQAILDANFTTKLKQVEVAMPGIKLPSKKLLLVLLSGIISFTFCVIVLFILFFFNNSIHTSKELANKTSVPVLGYLNLIKGNSLELHELWHNPKNNHEELRHFKSLLRSICFELNEILDTQKIVSVTSLHTQVGKTFILFNIAYAYTIMNKKVVIIDGNFDNPNVTTLSNTNFFIEDWLANKLNDEAFLRNQSDFLVLGNRGNDISLLELGNQSDIRTKLQLLSTIYDIVLIETPSLLQYNKAKEWISNSDRVIAIYEAGQKLDSSVKQEVDYLKESSKTIGWIINKIRSSTKA